MLHSTVEKIEFRTGGLCNEEYKMFLTMAVSLLQTPWAAMLGPANKLFYNHLTQTTWIFEKPIYCVAYFYQTEEKEVLFYRQHVYIN